jgi:hypothetical protein
MFLDNKYTRTYNKIITQAQLRVNQGYVERHHIIPRSLGGNDDSDNIVALTAREHFICHRLLVKMTAGKERQKMSYALHRITNKKVSYRITARTYEHIRREHSNMLSETLTGMSIQERFGKPYAHEISEYQRQRIRESNAARIWSAESRQKLSNSQKERYKQNPKSFNRGPMSLEHKKKLSEARKNNSTKHVFEHEDHGIFTGSTGDLARAYNIRGSEIYKLTKGIYKTYKGWKVVAS